MSSNSETTPRVCGITTNNQDVCLVEVIQPPTEQFPDGPRVRYDYDAAFRLASITDPKDQTFLRNAYDEQGRVTRQEHGNGSFAFQYKVTGSTAPSLPIYRTEIHQKNGARLLLQHNAEGQVIERTLFLDLLYVGEGDSNQSDPFVPVDPLDPPSSPWESSDAPPGEPSDPSGGNPGGGGGSGGGNGGNGGNELSVGDDGGSDRNTGPIQWVPSQTGGATYFGQNFGPFGSFVSQPGGGGGDPDESQLNSTIGVD